MGTMKPLEIIVKTLLGAALGLVIGFVILMLMTAGAILSLRLALQ